MLGIRHDTTAIDINRIIIADKVKPEEDEVKEVEKIVKEEEKAVNGKVEEEVSPLIIDQRPTDGSGDAPKATLKHSLIGQYNHLYIHDHHACVSP